MNDCRDRDIHCQSEYDDVECNSECVGCCGRCEVTSV